MDTFHYLMRPRHLQPRLLAALGDSRVVFLHGARQSGKSTLVQSLIGPRYRAQYLTLDDATVLSAAQRDAQGFVAAIEGPAILDEVQRVPDLLWAIKVAVDRDPRPGRFLLTGSANARVVPAIAEALAGRVELLTLWPFSQGEIDGTPEDFVDWLFTRKAPRPARLDAAWKDVIRRILRGGFPEVIERSAADRRRAWFGSYVTTILQRDVRDIADIEGLAEMPRLLAIAAARTSALLNHAEMSRSTSIPQTTLRRYFTILEATFLLRLVPPWLPNVGKRLVKSPKMVLCDTGLAASLLGADETRLQDDPSLTGRLLETFITMELIKQASWSDSQPHVHHYRSHARHEVDIVLEHPDGRIAGIEVKASASVAERDLRGLNDLAALAGERFFRGVVLYGGHQVVPFAPNLHALPLMCLWSAAP